MINGITSILVIVTLTCIPTYTIVGVLTQKNMQNPFAILLAIFFIYIGVFTLTKITINTMMIWMRI